MEDRFKFRVWNRENKKIYTWKDITDKKGNCSLYWCMLQVQNNEKNNILMQCTGVKDKNGRFIYEGDIVERDHVQGKKQGVVVFDKEALQFRATNMSLYSFKHRSVVIGNIYENPELLEASNGSVF